MADKKFSQYVLGKVSSGFEAMQEEMCSGIIAEYGSDPGIMNALMADGVPAPEAFCRAGGSMHGWHIAAGYMKLVTEMEISLTYPGGGGVDVYSDGSSQIDW